MYNSTNVNPIGCEQIKIKYVSMYVPNVFDLLCWFIVLTWSGQKYPNPMIPATARIMQTSTMERRRDLGSMFLISYTPPGNRRAKSLSTCTSTLFRMSSQCRTTPLQLLQSQLGGMTEVTGLSNHFYGSGASFRRPWPSEVVRLIKCLATTPEIRLTILNSIRQQTYIFYSCQSVAQSFIHVMYIFYI